MRWTHQRHSDPIDFATDRGAAQTELSSERKPLVAVVEEPPRQGSKESS